jgi:hypothetical protein
MSRSPRPFKESQVFDWGAEPKDERPSEFVPSTGYSALSGYYAMPDVRGARPRQRRGISGLLIATAIVVATGTAGLLGLLHLLRG